MAVRVLVVDDHPVVRNGIVRILESETEFAVVGEATDGAQAVALAARLQPDLVLMDLRMPVTSGAEATEEILRIHPDTRVVVLTTYASDSEVLRAIEAGAVGYLLKDMPREDLIRALKAVSKGERYLAPAVSARLMAHWHAPHRQSLTAREIEVLQSVSRGASNKQIAAELGITEPTVKAHLVHVFEKLGVDNRTAAVRAAIDRGIVE